MPSLAPSSSFLLSMAVVLILHSATVHAFGAGNIASISAIEGQNWRHGDIEDTLLNILMARGAGGKKFSKLDVKRVYFGNWLRDYSQAVDVGAVKYVSAEAVRLILWVLGFMSFGYGSGPFEVTRDRLGCYRPEEHIDNPKDYADNIDARDYDRRLRGPVDERRELAVDERNGLKAYIASEDHGITTSAGLVRNLFGRCIELGRQYIRSKNKDDLYEALRLLGTGCHCLEDYSAHSNYVELALIELGERDIFPHVGRDTQIRLQGARGPVFPIVTGTFGGTDFLHSVMGEFSDKATQSEIQQLEGTIQSTQNGQDNFSALKDLLDKVPDGIFGDDQSGKASEVQSNAQAAQMEHTHISPREPEDWANQLGQIFREIYPAIEWHDNLMLSISETIEKIPILPELLDQLTEQINQFVFSLIAPLVLPVIKQVKNELATGSSEIIESSRQQQHIVFHDHRCSDPTHSMLSKDHFSNILNEPAGKTASQVLKWVVPQIMEAWDDERADINRILTRIITGVFHHPAQRQYGEDGASDGRRGMFQVVEQWWNEKSEREKNGLRDQLSRDGVEQGRNHKPGVKDSGHGCGKPIGMPTMKTATSSGAIGGVPVGNIIGEINSALSGQSQYDSGGSRPSQGGSSEFGKLAGDAVGGGALGGIVGGLAGAIGGDLLGDAFGGQKKSSKRESYGDDGSYTQTYNQRGYGQSEGGQQYGQAQYSQTNYPGGGQREEYRREERTSGGYGSSTYESKTETSYGTSSYQRTTESRYGEGERSQGDGSQSYGQTYGETEVNSEEEKKRKKKEKKEKKKQKKYKKRDSEDDEDNEGDDDDEDEEEEDSDDNRKKRQGGSRRQEETYGQESYGGRSSGYGQETYGGSSGYGEERREEGYGGDSGGYGGRNNDNDDNDGGYGRRGGDDDDNGNRGYQERRGYGNDY